MTLAPTKIRHDAKFSPEVLEILRPMLERLDGPIVDPFAGTGLLCALARDLGRKDVFGIEREEEWAAMDRQVRHGDAMDQKAYPKKVQRVITSVCYGNRLAGNYLGPKCHYCEGWGTGCALCGGSGHDRRGRFGYAIALGRKLTPGSAALMQWGPKYRAFHQGWLRLIADLLPAGPERLILNVSDHDRRNERAYVCSWWLIAAHREGFRLADVHRAETTRIGFGQNRERRADAEMVFVFDLLGRTSTD